MASTFGTANFAQDSYRQDWQSGFPGQLVSEAAQIGDLVKTYPNVENIAMGTGVVQAITQPTEASSSTPYRGIAPFSVTVPDVGTVAADLVGIAMRTLITTTNIQFNGNTVAGYAAKDKAAIVPFGSRALIYVQLPSTPPRTITVNEAVYMAINPVNDPNIAVGEFMNDSAGTTGLLLVPNAVWWSTITTTADFNIGVINLL